tara:strand:- start:666 stop:3239 length:2574 start_codon:yes stop_codon:yes gene_type:complete
MSESLQTLRSLVERYFQQTKEIDELRQKVEKFCVDRDKLEVKLSNREATIDYLNNEVQRENLLKENRMRMLDVLTTHLKEINVAVEDLSQIISDSEQKRIGFFGSKRKLREMTAAYSRIAQILESKPLREVSYHEVPPKINLIQNKYTPPEILTALEPDKGFDCDFQEIDSGALEMKLSIPQTEWESLQRFIQGKFGEEYMQYCFGGKIRLLKRDHLIHEMNKTACFFNNLKNKVSDKKCVVIGNGPSLNKHDFKLMSGNFMIGSNYIFLNRDHMGYFPDLITATNFLVVEQRIEEFLEIPVPKIFPFYMYSFVGPKKDVYYVNVNHLPEFSENIQLWASTRSTVTYFNLQIAYWLGFQDTFLIGVDNTYKQGKNKREGNIINQKEDDPNHFSAEYFKGLKWQAADPDNMASFYSLAKEYFEGSGRNIYNAGIGGALEVFPRTDYRAALKNKKKKALNTDTGAIERVIVSINPDLQTYFGHYYQLDLKMSDFLSKKGDGFIILANKQVDLDLAVRFPFIFPCFDEHSYTVGLRNVNETDTDQLFSDQLEAGIKRVQETFPDAKRFDYYMYCGAYPHIKGVNRILKKLVADKRKDIRFHIHVFYPSFENAFHRDSREVGKELFQNFGKNDQLKLYAGTEMFRSHLTSNYSIDVECLPCFSTTFVDHELDHFRNDFPENSEFICFPGNMRPEKGLAVTIQSLFLLAEDREADDLRFVVRRIKRTLEEDPVDYYRCMLSERIRWVEGELSDEEFKDMMAGSGIIVVPYGKEAFEMRPSGLFADAMLLEKPVLVEDGTFMASTVRMFGNGMVYEPGNARDLLTKLKKMKAGYKKLKLACKFARKTWEQDNSWSAFYKKLTN